VISAKIQHKSTFRFQERERARSRAILGGVDGFDQDIGQACQTGDRPKADNWMVAEGDHRDQTTSPAASTSAGSIVIELGHGRRIRVDRDFVADALRRVIDVLDRRR
jgi:hypothetical protein